MHTERFWLSRAACAVVVCLSLVSIATGEAYWLPPGEGDWMVPTNWVIPPRDPGVGVDPTNATGYHSFRVQNGGTAVISDSTAGCHDLRVDNNSGVRLHKENGTIPKLVVSNEAHVGHNGVGWFTQGSNTQVESYWFNVGEYAGSNGTLTLEQEADFGAHWLNVGHYGGTGTVYHNGATVSVGVDPIPDYGWVSIAFAKGSVGTYHLNGGTLHANSLNVGCHGQGTFNHIGGDVMLDYMLYVGIVEGEGVYHMTGGHLVTGGGQIGKGTKGTFIQDGGEVNVSLVLGVDATGEGIYELKQGSLGARQSFVGYYGTGLLEQTGGGLVCNALMVLGEYAGSEGIYRISAGTAYIDSHLYVGNRGRGALEVLGDELVELYVDNLEVGRSKNAWGGVLHTGGLISAAGHVYLGRLNGAEGEYHLDGFSALEIGGNMYVGSQGSAIFTQEWGSVLADSDVIIGHESTGEGHYELRDGLIECQRLFVGDAGTGTMKQTDGFVVAEDVHVGYRGMGEYRMEGGTIEAQRLTIGSYGGEGRFTYTGGSLEPEQLTVYSDYEPDSLTGFHAEADWIFGGSLYTYGMFNFGEEWSFTLDGSGEAPPPPSASSQNGPLPPEGPGENPFGAQAIMHGRTIAKDLVVGDSGQALLIASGVLSVHNNLVVGIEPGSLGRVILQTEAANVGGKIVVGDGGEGDLEIYAYGGSVAAPEVVVGLCAGSEGSVAVYDGTLSTPQLTLGEEGAGGFTQDGGRVDADVIVLGLQVNSVGVYELTDGLLDGSELRVAQGGAGLFDQSGGTAIVTDVIVAKEAGAEGECELTGGELQASRVRVGQLGTGVVTQSGGMMHVVEELRVGGQLGGSGTYTITDGELNVVIGKIGVGLEGGTGKFELDGGVVYVDEFEIGDPSNFSSAEASSLLRVNTLTGFSGHTVFGGDLELGHVTDQPVEHEIGAGDAWTVKGSLTVGYDADDTRLFLHGGDVASGSTRIGVRSAGAFYHLSGHHRIETGLVLGQNDLAESASRYEMSNGTLSCLDLIVGLGGKNARFDQRGGTVTVEDTLYVGIYGSASGNRYSISGGTLTADKMVVGDEAERDSLFEQTGSATTVHVTGELTVGRTDNDATYRLAGGNLRSGSLLVTGNSLFEQTGGTYTVDRNVVVDRKDGTGPGGHYVLADGRLNVAGGFTVGPDRVGRLTLSGGIFSADVLGIGSHGRGELSIGRGALVTVTRHLVFGEDSSLEAAPRSVIYMEEASEFEIYSSNPAEFAGLGNLGIVFDGGSEAATFEVSGSDIGPYSSGFNSNFALGTLALGGAKNGHVRLINRLNNLPGDEALYVKNLQIRAGSVLDLNGLPLYFYNAAISPYATIVGGTLQCVAFSGTDAVVEGVPEGFNVNPVVEPGSSYGLGSAGLAGADPIALAATTSLDPEEVDPAVAAAADGYLTLKLFYDQDEIGMLGLDENSLRLYWYDAAGEVAGSPQWYLGGTTITGEKGAGEFAGLNVDLDAFGLGYSGLNTIENYVWAKVNHASQYGTAGVVPEPATLALLALGGLALMIRRNRPDKPRRI